MRDGGEVTEEIDDLLSAFTVRAHIAFRGLACGRWGIGGPTSGRLAFHLVVRGGCWARVPDAREPVALGPGALLLYRPTTWHLLTSSADDAVVLMPERLAPLDAEERGPHLGLVCGHFEGVGAHSPLIDALPDYLLWRGFDALPDALAALTRALATVAFDLTRAGEHIVARLFEVLLHMVLREPSNYRRADLDAVRARCDPKLRRVLDALHAEPARRWTLETLARRAGMSRSTFAERFRAVTGVPAMTWLRQHRLALAERRMKEEGMSAGQVARAAGFGSAAALRRVRRRASLDAGS